MSIRVRGMRGVRGMRIVSTVLSLGISVGGLGTLVVLSQQGDRFPLKGMEIRSVLQHVSESDIRAVVSPHLEKGFFWVNVEKVQDSLKRIAWVQSVEVRRVWPDRLAIVIKEKTAQAKWSDNAVLSTEGTIFYPEFNTIPETLPQFEGPETRAKEMQQHYLSLLELLGPIGLRVKTLTLSLDGSWKIMLDNGIAIILGRAGLAERLARFVLIYPGRLQTESEKIAYVDLRYTNGVAIGWKEGFKQEQHLGLELRGG